MISPDLGSDTLGPTAFLVVLATYLIDEYRTSSILNSGSSSLVGGYLAMIAFLNPAVSKTFCQSSTPCLIYFLNFFGVAGSK